MMSERTARAYAQAWTSGNPEAVADFYAADGAISINRGAEQRGRAAIVQMAAGFYAEFPDLVVYLDGFRRAGDHAVFKWTLEGHHAQTRNHVRASGWEEWDLDANGKVAFSRGWFDADDYARQIAGG